ncbi:hypothetical protein VT91_31750 [Clostridium sporogenes]|uniref:hypothetical protein n=1 Tax=Clostridium botulinum TaxID=1491 RepID=UPI00071798C8|nr:hypothetical protein [Clostridium botulinum]KRU24420.1 hypothetical protein WG71_32300 [Clostridium sporogenes]KRU25672.1 hypothetical protein VT91_31750 [Clostridium sporogenes]KRU30717.1 hypothetical protein VT28_16270 [Clostridium sporogenes]KRU50183.1 hypothetical protein VT95_01020 [Clostridium sporogenes]MBZ1331183.1 hypothetical protein [Clostridium botulinum]
MKVLDRLKLELNNKDYFSDEEYTIYLQENDLTPTDEYIKKDMQKDLLITVVDILESVSNDVDLMRKVTDGSTEFTTNEAYKLLRKRIEDIKQRIASIPVTEEDYSNVSLLFTRSRR